MLLVVVILAWVVAAGGLISGIFDVSAFPEGLRNILELWPDPGTMLGTVVRFGAVAVLIAAIVAYRVLGNADKGREQDQIESVRVTHVD
ncbi:MULTISPECIES: hypothetical protein [unclassified Microbacterium]|uniref:hypothetical protein n=1 Tax=unclassified Microbacterium TaxID=2609290 RepID=UPI00214B68D1|nr:MULTISPECIES: hypothetical protein [unclassified Microbacterium]MCR2784798.1 hypothetical protein [Microbacterium sp. zg.B96]WIM16337.1 hypothetical protein QNO11_01515 [Microbacterium sp. zg-B96]